MPFDSIEQMQDTLLGKWCIFCGIALHEVDHYIILSRPINMGDAMFPCWIIKGCVCSKCVVQKGLDTRLGLIGE